MTILVFIHGAWHDKNCWNKVIESLQQAQTPIDEIFAINLPGRDIPDFDFNSCTQKFKLSDYVEYVTNALVPYHQDIILIGHSMAGVLITQLAHNLTHKIKQLIYIAAFVPLHKESLFDITKQMEEDGIATEFEVSPKKTFIRLKPSNRTSELLYGNTPALEENSYLDRLKPEPFLSFVEKTNIVDSSFKNIPKIYIKTRQDRLINLEFQDKMIACLHNPTVITINSGHAPFFETPRDLAMKIVESI